MTLKAFIFAATAMLPSIGMADGLTKPPADGPYRWGYNQLRAAGPHACHL